MLNFIYMCQVSCCSAKLRKDQKFKDWKKKYWCTFFIVMLVSTLVSFKFGSLLYSYFLGRKRYLAEIGQKKSFFRIQHNVSIAFIILGNTVLIIIDLAALTFYKWGSQFYIMLLETIITSVLMVFLQVFDLQHAKKIIKFEENLKAQLGGGDDEEQNQPVIQPREGDDENPDEAKFQSENKEKFNESQRIALLGKGSDEQPEIYTPRRDSLITEDEMNGKIKLSLSPLKENENQSQQKENEDPYQQNENIDLSQINENEDLSPQKENEDQFLHKLLNISKQKGRMEGNVDFYSDSQKLESIKSEEEVSSEAGHIRRLRPCSHGDQSFGRNHILEMDPAQPDGLRSGNQSQVMAPIYPEQRNFNENDVLGNLDRDALNRPIPVWNPNLAIYQDKQGRQVNLKGYLLDQDGDIVNQRGDLVFEKEEMQQNGELPLVFAIERHNFNPFDILGNVTNQEQLHKLKDFNGRKINEFGFLVDDQGNIINRRNRKILDKGVLEENGDFPQLLSFNAQSFYIKDILGELHRNKVTGDAVQKQDSCGSRWWDKHGREVNQRGYLVDKQGNVINKNGNIIFQRNQLTTEGDIPKIFPFTHFNQSDVMGKYQIDPLTDLPVIIEDAELPEGQFKDDEGATVNKLGFLVQPEGHICDKENRKVFDYEILEDDHTNIPLVFRKGMGLRNESESVLPSLQNFETEASAKTPNIEVRQTIDPDKRNEDQIFSAPILIETQAPSIIHQLPVDESKIDAQEPNQQLRILEPMRESASSLLKEEQQPKKPKVVEIINPSMLTPQLLANERTFNENEIQGDLDLDADLKPIIKRLTDNSFIDNLGRPVSVKGYLIDDKGNIVNQEGFQVFKKEDLRNGVDLPVLNSLERFNFNPLDILGNIEEATLQHLKPNKDGLYLDKNGKKISKFGFLLNKHGDIINRKNRKILRNEYLKPNGDFPSLLNYQGLIFELKEILGELVRDSKTGEAILKKDTKSGRYFDMNGHEINKRGYIVDRNGNVINKKGRKIFDKIELNKHGDIPKLFTFTQFDEEAIKGQYLIDANDGMPILRTDPLLPKGIFYDNEGAMVNKNGFLVDLAGNILDDKGNVIFTKSVLTDGLKNIPLVFQKNLQPIAGQATVKVIPKVFSTNKSKESKLKIPLATVVEEKVRPENSLKNKLVNQDLPLSPVQSINNSFKTGIEQSILTGKIPDFATNESVSDVAPLSKVFMLKEIQEAAEAKVANYKNEIDQMINNLIEEDKDSDSYGYEEQSSKFGSTVDGIQVNGVKRKRKKMKSRQVKGLTEREKQMQRIYKNDNLSQSATSTLKSLHSTQKSSRKQTAFATGFPKLHSLSPPDQRSMTGNDFSNTFKGKSKLRGTDSRSMVGPGEKPDVATLKFLNDLIEGEEFHDEEEQKILINKMFDSIKEKQETDQNYRRRPRMAAQITTLQVPNTPSVEERKLTTKQSMRSINSKSSARPNIIRLQNVAEQYLQPLSRKQDKRNHLNKTTTSGFQPNLSGFGGFAGVGKMVCSSKGSARDYSGGGGRETWNQVYTEPSIVAEKHVTRDIITQKLKESFLHNNDYEKFQQVQRLDSLEKNEEGNKFWGPKQVWTNNTQVLETQEKRKRDKDHRMIEVLSGNNSINNSPIFSAAQSRRNLAIEDQNQQNQMLIPHSISPKDHRPPLASKNMPKLSQLTKSNANASRSLQPKSRRQ